MQSDWSQFIGRFHPLLVHLPIGFILFAAILRFIAVYKKNVFLETSINIALLTGAFAALGSVLSGLFLSQSGGYNTDTLSWHKWIGITITILLFALWFVRKKIKKKSVLKVSFDNWLLIACIILIMFGGHLGGKMTHGENYLTEYMPPSLPSIFGASRKPVIKKPLLQLDSVKVFTDIIQPIFDKHCVSCHNTDKQKGELLLTNKEQIQKGGKSGNTIVAGNIEKSELFHRITLSPQNRKFMPAGNASPLTPVEIFLIRDWINSGADYEKNITSSGVDEKTKFLIAAYLGIDTEKEKEITLPAAPAFDSVLLQSIRSAGLVIHPLAIGSNLLEASFVMLQQRSTTEIFSVLEKLTAVKKQLYRLDISNCQLSTASIKIIADFSILNKLEIQQTNLTNEMLSPLTNLQQLEILNAGQNPLTDESISLFKKMIALKKLNIWQTQITETAAKNLQTESKSLAVEY